MAALINEMMSAAKAVDLNWPLNRIQATDWSNQWERELVSTVDELAESAAAMQQSLGSFSAALGLSPCQDGSAATLEELSRLCGMILQINDDEIEIAFDKQFSKLMKSISSLDTAFSGLAAAKSRLSADYAETTLHEIPVADLDRQWREACVRFWPMSIFAKRGVQKMLQTYADSVRLIHKSTSLNFNHASSKAAGNCSAVTEPFSRHSTKRF